jgi:hypothetical protein
MSLAPANEPPVQRLQDDQWIAVQLSDRSDGTHQQRHEHSCPSGPLPVTSPCHDQQAAIGVVGNDLEEVAAYYREQGGTRSPLPAPAESYTPQAGSPAALPEPASPS